MKILFKLMMLCIIPSLHFGLMPKRLPNGKPYKYTANTEDRSSDLKVIKPAQASLISRNWLQNLCASRRGFPD